MKIGTQNRLAHYQCEYQELCEQTQMLQGQVAPLQMQINQLQQYCSMNNGDRAQMANLRQQMTRLNTLVNTIARNQRRLQTLERQIATENNKIIVQQQRAQMKMMMGGRRRYY